MARTADPHGAEQIVRVLAQHPEGATIDQIAQAISVPRRTLQRRLAALGATGTLRAVAGGKQRRYQLAANHAVSFPFREQDSRCERWCGAR